MHNLRVVPVVVISQYCQLRHILKPNQEIGAGLGKSRALAAVIFSKGMSYEIPAQDNYVGIERARDDQRFFNDFVSDIWSEMNVGNLRDPQAFERFRQSGQPYVYRFGDHAIVGLYDEAIERAHYSQARTGFHGKARELAPGQSLHG